MSETSSHQVVVLSMTTSAWVGLIFTAGEEGAF